jgi:hypothetical protein
MPLIRTSHAVRLEFPPDALVHSNLSGAAFHGEWLWVVGDEAAGIDRLRRLEPLGPEALRYGDGLEFKLADLLDLPGEDEEEADLEGMAVVGDWLWVVGSHGFKRKKVDPDADHAKNAKRLAKTSLDGNRRLLARLPIEVDAEGVPSLVRKAADGRRAACLEWDGASNQLIDLLAKDAHFGPFIDIPGKDNGLDIEGLAVLGDRLLLGLRGPVLRGWSAMLEVAAVPRGNALALAPLDDDGTLVRKHFLPLLGLGVRDLQMDGDDLYILAGPTMVLDGDIRVFQWPGARAALAADTAPVRFEHSFADPVLLPHQPGCDRAEALCALPDGLLPGPRRWLVLYDAPAPDRQDGASTVFGDLLARAG